MPPVRSVSEILEGIGEAGSRVAGFDGAEGAAGNISIFTSYALDLENRFTISEEIELPVPAPSLVGGFVIVTGSGRRLRDIARASESCIGVVQIHADGLTGTLYSAECREFARLTSEWNSHLGIHEDRVARTGTKEHFAVHAQSPNLVFLSHLPAYRDESFFNSRLLRWEPETIINLPMGIGVLPYLLPGSSDMMSANVESLRTHRLSLWAKHGVMARSDDSVGRAVDLIEYAETAARYEYMDLLSGGIAEGLSKTDLSEIVRAFKIPTTLY
jgi:rhamnulose-1-phosphate aldolase